MNQAILPHFLSSLQHTSGHIENSPLEKRKVVSIILPKYAIPSIIEILHKNSPFKKNGSDVNIMCRSNPQNALKKAKEKTLFTFLKPKQAAKISKNPIISLKISI